MLIEREYWSCCLFLFLLVETNEDVLNSWTQETRLFGLRRRDCNSEWKWESKRDSISSPIRNWVKVTVEKSVACVVTDWWKNDIAGFSWIFWRKEPNEDEWFRGEDGGWRDSLEALVLLTNGAELLVGWCLASWSLVHVPSRACCSTLGFVVSSPPWRRALWWGEQTMELCLHPLDFPVFFIISSHSCLTCSCSFLVWRNSFTRFCSLASKARDTLSSFSFHLSMSLPWQDIILR